MNLTPATPGDQPSPRVGFFTRLMEDATAAERYRYALEQIRLADDLGFHTAWVAQHHVQGAEGGLPSPFVLLAAAAQATQNIRLGTAIVSLPLENPVRVAEDAAVVDLLSGGRLELGLGSGANPTTFPLFGYDFAQRREVFAQKLAVLRDLLAGRELSTGHRLYPPAQELTSSGAESGSGPGFNLGSGSSLGAGAESDSGSDFGAESGRSLGARLWQATFSVAGAEKAGEAGDGLMTSRSQPRPADNQAAALHELQLPMLDAYYAALPQGTKGRVLASRTAFVTDDPQLLAQIKARTITPLRAEAPKLIGYDVAHLDDEQVFAATNTYLGSPAQVAHGLAADLTLTRVSDVSFQVHSVPATHAETLRSLELLAGEVFPALGWR